MAATTFHRFGELPQELQIEIWKYSATPRSGHSKRTYRKHQLYVNNHQHCRLSSLLLNVTCQRRFVRVRGHQAHNCAFNRASVAGTRLMGTCRLAREVTLKLWKMEIQLLAPNDRFYGCFVWGEYEDEKARILGRLDCLIKYLFSQLIILGLKLISRKRSETQQRPWRNTESRLHYL